MLPLLPHVSSSLRSIVRHTILTDLKTSNAKAKNHRLNRVVQALLFGMVESGMDAAVVGDKGKGKKKGQELGGEAMWAVMIVRELWKKGVWTDAKTVSIAALAAFHPDTKVQSAAIHFFLGSETDEVEDSDEEDGVREARRDVKSLQHKMEVGKSGRKKQRLLKEVKKDANKVGFSTCDDRGFVGADSALQKQKAKAAGVGATPNFPALELLHDPQTFGEKLYGNLHKHGELPSRIRGRTRLIASL